MNLSKRQITQLQNLIETAQAILAEASDKAPIRKIKVSSRGSAPKRTTRRSGKELVAFKKTLRADRKNGVSVAELAKRHRVSPSYIYQL
jgi:Mor family transcriptional regulator